jgi:perosamine synthetase
MSIREIPPVKPYFPQEDIRLIKNEVEKILQSGMLTLGAYTKSFESEFAKLSGVSHAVAVNSGTSALEIALRALGLKRGDEVLVPTNTFTATAAAVIFAGGKPVFTDVNAQSLCLDVENVQKHLTSKTRAMIIVHVGGLICPDIKAIRELCEDNRLLLVEDAAHAHGSTINRQPAGSIGDAGCFSFYPTKVMTTGEGGMITTKKEEIAKEASILRDQGKESFTSNNIVKLGYNWRMNEISAAIGMVQLKRLSGFIRNRNRIAKHYDEKLSSMNHIEPRETPSSAVNNYYKYVAFLSPQISRSDFKEKLREKGVRCSGEVYWPPLHRQPVYQNLLKTKEGDFPVAEEVCRSMVCLPMYSQMTLDEAKYVTEKVQEVLSRA